MMDVTLNAVNKLNDLLSTEGYVHAIAQLLNHSDAQVRDLLYT